MANDIFELSTITLSGEILSGHRSATTATFKIYKNAVLIASPSAPLKDKKCSLPWRAPDVADGENSYALSFKMEIEGRDYNLTARYNVWPRWVRVTALRKVDLKLFQRFKIRVQQGSSVAAITDLKGTYLAFLREPAPVEFTAQPPGVITEWVEARGRKRVFKAERKYKAEFVAPIERAKAYMQLVNLATKDKGRDHRSSSISVKVGAAGDTRRANKDRLGHEGDVIFVKAVFGRESKRNTPLPAIRDALEIAHTPDGKEYTAKVKLGALGEAARFTLELGLAGGDTCTLSIGSTDACADAKISFVTGRKLYFQLTHPKVLAEPDMSFMTAGLDGVKVRYKRYKTVTFKETDVPAAPVGSWFDGKMVDANLSGRCVNIGDHNKGFFHAKFVDTNHPVGVHVLVCHTQFDGGTGNAQLASLAAVLIKKTSAKVKFPPVGGSRVRGAAIDASGVGGEVFPVAFQDGGTGWRNARWRCTAATGPHVGANGAVGDDHIDVNWRKRPNVVTVKLPANAAALVEAGLDVEVSLDVYYALGPYNGEAAANLQLIRTRPPADGGDKGMNGTMLHELGHTMKQVLKSVPPGLSAATHGRKYVKRGHLGPHCAEGLPAALFNDLTKDLSGREDCACVMYGEGATNRPVTFCAKCTPFVQAEDYRDITT